MEGITGGSDKIADVEVTVTYATGLPTVVVDSFADNGQFDSTDYPTIDGSRIVTSVTILSLDDKNGFRLNNVEAGAISQLDPADLDFDFTLTLVDQDGDDVSQDFEITLRGSEDGVYETNVAPITIDLNGDGVDYLSREAGVVFTDQATGDAVSTAWVGADDGLLVLDANQSGTVDETKEYVFTEWSDTAETDMEAVAQVFDTNQDGVLDANDEQFGQFAVWQDADSDGVTDEGELTSLTDLGVDSIALTYSDDSESGTAAGGDVLIHGQSTVTFTDGSTSTADDASFAQESLDLRDLLSGDEAADDLSSYLNVSFDGADTVIEVSSSGAFTGGPSDAGAVDQTFTVEGVDLVGTDELSTVIQNMLTNGQLITD